MKNISNTKRILKITFSLGTLAILVLGVMVMPEQASARGYRYNYDYNPGPGYVREDVYGGSGTYTVYHYQEVPVYVNNPEPIYINNPAPVYVNPAPLAYVNPAPAAPQTTPTIYSSTYNPNAKISTSKKVAKATTTKSTVATKTTTPESDLAANAIFGSNSFIPSGLIQWIIFAILVLLATILVRKIYGGNEKYNSTPLKHD